MRNALVLGAILVAALLVRSIGFSWGDDFPGGFRGHHVDEWTHVAVLAWHQAFPFSFLGRVGFTCGSVISAAGVKRTVQSGE